jgi:hypothetical protein
MINVSTEEVETLVGIILGGTAHLRINHRKGSAVVTDTTNTDASTEVSELRVMFDSADIAAIPTDPAPQLVAWYPFAWKGDIDRFDASKTSIVTIDNDGGSPTCDVLDVETGAASLADIPGWLASHENETHDLGTLYSDQSNLAAVAKVLAKSERSVYLWVADWTGEPHIFSGDVYGMHLVATQYRSPTSVPASPGVYDLSIVSDSTWHALAKPEPKPDPTPNPDPTHSTTGGIVTYVSNGQLAQFRVSTSDLKTWTVS